jgi:hypothetical protein
MINYNIIFVVVRMGSRGYSYNIFNLHVMTSSTFYVDLVLGNFQALGIMFLSSTYVKYGKTVPFLMKVHLLPFVIFICHEALSECLRI